MAAQTTIMINGRMVIKNVRNCLNNMVLTQSQQIEINKDGGLDRMLCATEGCYSLAMVRDSRKQTYKRHCSKCNNAESAKKDLQHTRMLNGLVSIACEDCGMDCPVKGDKGVMIEIHHINGNHYDNRRSNLKALCAKCHLNNYTLVEKQYESYEKRFGMTKEQMKAQCKANGLYYYNPNA